MIPRSAFGRWCRFALVGIVNTSVDMAVFYALSSIVGLPALDAHIFSYGCGILTSYAGNRRFTFRRRVDAPGRWASQLAPFVAASAAGLVLSSILLLLLLTEFSPLVAKAATVIATAAFNYQLAGRIFQRD